MKIPVRVQNPTPARRYAVATTVLTFKPGEFAPEDWCLEQVEPFGGLHPDDSVHQARVRFPVWLEPNEVREEVLPRMPRDKALAAGLGKAKAALFGFHRSITPARLLGVTFELHEDATVDDLQLLLGLEPVPEASGSMVQQYRSRNHAGTTWAELTLELYSEAPYARWWLLSSCSYDDIGLRATGCELVVHGEASILTGALLFGPGASSEDTSTLEAEAIAPTIAGVTFERHGSPELWGATS